MSIPPSPKHMPAGFQFFLKPPTPSPPPTFTTEAATLPLCYTTAALALYQNLRLPPPFRPLPASTRHPLLIHGASSAVGAFAIKLARASNIHPILAVCGAGAPYVRTLLDGSAGDAVIDYRAGGADLVTGIQNAAREAGCEGVADAFDATTAEGSWGHLADAMGGRGKMTFVLFEWMGKGLPAGMELTQTHVGVVHGGGGGGGGGGEEDGEKGDGEGEGKRENAVRDFAFVYLRLLTRGLRDGWMTPHPYRVVQGGLSTGVEEALGELKAGKASATKYVVPI